jgi:hypothetical protein
VVIKVFLKEHDFIRILIVEDDKGRVRQIKEWLPSDVRLVHAGSARRLSGFFSGTAMLALGIMLDHELQGQIAPTWTFHFLAKT